MRIIIKDLERVIPVNEKLRFLCSYLDASVGGIRNKKFLKHINFSIIDENGEFLVCDDEPREIEQYFQGEPFKTCLGQCFGTCLKVISQEEYEKQLRDDYKDSLYFLQYIVERMNNGLTDTFEKKNILDLPLVFSDKKGKCYVAQHVCIDDFDDEYLPLFTIYVRSSTDYKDLSVCSIQTIEKERQTFLKKHPRFIFK